MQEVKEEVYKTTKKKNENVRGYISFSEFNLFSECAHKHLVFKHLCLLEQPDSVHLYFGSAIHSALESALTKKTNLEETIKIFQEKFTAGMESMKHLLDYERNFLSFLKRGEMLIRHISLKELLKDCEIIAVEEPLFVEIGDGVKFFFKGFIDLVIKNRITGKYKILDWKTSTAPWNYKYKLSDEAFLCQMRFYKYFWCRKNNINLNDVFCGYIVLNRFEHKPFKNEIEDNIEVGDIQTPEINASENEIMQSLEQLSIVVKKIHIDKVFEKVKYSKEGTRGCIFCMLKDGTHVLCNQDKEQYKILLNEYKRTS